MVAGRRGRPQVSSRAQVEAAAFELFFDRGYSETSIMDIVAVAGDQQDHVLSVLPPQQSGADVVSLRRRHPRPAIRVGNRAR